MHHLKRQSQDLVTLTPMDEDVQSPLVSPLPMENLFHPLLDTDGEEDAHHIIINPSPSIIKDVPLSIRHSTTLGFYLVLQ